MQLSVDEDLAFGDVACEIGDGMGDVVVWHAENGDLRNGTVAAFDSACALVDGAQVGVHVAGVTTASGHFFAGCRDFAEGVAVGGQVCKDDKDVFLELVGVVFSSCEGKARSDDTFDSGVCWSAS